MKKYETGMVLVVFFIVFISGSFAESRDIEKASDAEKKGNITEALNIYEEWLAGNQKSDNYYRILLHMCNIEPDPEKSLKIMKKYEKTVSKENTGDYYNRMAILEEMTGEIENAEKSYKKAWELESGNAAYSYLLSSAVMLFYMGNLRDAEKEALTVSKKSNDNYTAAKSRFLISSIYAANGNMGKAAGELEYLRKKYPDSNLIPSVLSKLIFLYREQNKNEKSKSLLQELKNKYPGSIQYKILASGNNGRIRYFPNPAFLLNGNIRKGSEMFNIQAGSFGIKENAYYLVRDLKKIGFNAHMTEVNLKGKRYYRVIVGPVRNIASAQKMIDRLTEKGFSGFMVK